MSGLTQCAVCNVRYYLRCPYKRLEIRPSPSNLITHVYVDKELGNEAFTYVLESGDEGSVHIDSVLEYNGDPGYQYLRH